MRGIDFADAYRRLRLHTDLQRYRTARDHVHIIIETAKLAYYQNRLTKLTDSRKIWKELKNLVICATRSNYSSAFSSKELNQHFGGVAHDANEPSVSIFCGVCPVMRNTFHISSSKRSVWGMSSLRVLPLKPAVVMASRRLLY